MRNRQLFFLGILWLVLACVTLGYELWRQPTLIVQWTTETEVNTAGFNIYRATTQDGPYEQISAQLIPSKGDPLTGSDYEFVDKDVRVGQQYFYQLEDVEINGQANRTELTMGQTPGRQVWILVLASVGILIGTYFIFSSFLGKQTPRPEFDTAASEVP